VKIQRVLLAIVLFSALGFRSLFSGDPSATEPERSDPLEGITRRLDVLEEEVIRLKTREYAGGATESVLGMGPAASKVYRVKEGVSLGGYGELLYQAIPGKTNTLDLLRLITYIGYRFDERFLFNSEIEIEHAFVKPPEKPGELEVEFAYLEYGLSPYARIRGGLILLPMGFLNELHEPTVFISARRPGTETLIIPTTFRENGLGVVGTAGILTYKIYLMNSLKGEEFSGANGFREGRQSGAKANADHFMGVGSLTLSPWEGFQVGGSLLQGTADAGLSRGPLTFTIGEVHAEYRYSGLWLRGLLAGSSIHGVSELNERRVEEGLEHVKPEQVTAEEGRLRKEGIGSRPWGGYLEVGYDLLTLLDSPLSLSPYLRWERVDTQARLGEGFARNPSYDRRFLNLGLNFKPIPQLVLKGEVQWEGNRSQKLGEGDPSYFVNLGYVF
jgi:hypothetical protein